MDFFHNDGRASVQLFCLVADAVGEQPLTHTKREDFSRNPIEQRDYNLIGIAL